jgi:hypothetical protein
VDTHRSLITLLVTLLSIISGRITWAQSNTLEPLTPSNGVIESGGEQVWIFSGTGGSVISLLAESVSGSLDPAITLLNSRGQVLISNDDYDFPTLSSALLQAITLPSNDQFSVRITGINGTSGDYTLTLTPGFTDIAAVDNFNGDTGWSTSNGDLSEADGQLTLALQGALQTALASRENLTTANDFFAETRISITGSNGWIVGFAYRQQNDESYWIRVNSRGEWRLEIQSVNERRILRDWTAHPALSGNRATFTLGMLANGSGMDFFLDGQLFGRFTDSTLLTGTGISLLVETPDGLDSRVTANLDELTITVPRRVNNQTVLPQTLIAAAPVDLIRDLQRQSVIPAGGELAFNVEESFVESRIPGVERFLLARESNFTGLVLGARVTLQTAAPGATGCGLVFGNTADDNYYLTYVDANGGQGVSRREGAMFQPGIFREHLPDAANTYDLLVIAVGGRILYYVNQEWVGTLNESPSTGTVGNAVVNFEPIATSCQFNNTWVWRWESTS